MAGRGELAVASEPATAWSIGYLPFLPAGAFAFGAATAGAAAAGAAFFADFDFSPPLPAPFPLSKSSSKHVCENEHMAPDLSKERQRKKYAEFDLPATEIRGDCERLAKPVTHPPTLNASA